MPKSGQSRDKSNYGSKTQIDDKHNNTHRQDGINR